MKKIIICLFVIFGLGLFLNNNTYAVSDYVENISGVSGNQPVLSNCDITCYQQYHYAIIEYTPAVSNYSFAIKANFTIGNTTGYGKPFYFAHNSGFNLIDITGISSVFVGDGTFSFPAKITLTENLPGPAESDCPEPVIPDCDEPFIVRLFEGSFWNIATACVGIFVSILALFLVFRLIHGLIYGKGV